MRKILLFVALIALMSCVQLEPVLIKRPHNVNEKCRVYRNWGVSNDVFMDYVYRMVPDGWSRVRVIRWTGAMMRRGQIITVVVYYD